MNDPFARARECFLRGLHAQEQSRHAEAEACYREALQYAPGRPSVLNNLATVLLTTGRHAEALAICEQLLAADPNDVVALLNAGACAARQGDPAGALAAFERILALEPEHVDALSSASAALCQLGRRDEALERAERALARVPEHPGALNNKATVLRESGRLHEALAILDLVLARHPDHLEALNNRGAILADLLQFEAALAAYDRALAQASNDATALAGSGTALMQLRRHAEAVERLEAALRTDPTSDYVTGNLLHAQLQIGDWRHYAERKATVAAGIRAGRLADTPFTFLSVSGDPHAQLACAQGFLGDQYGAPASRVPARGRGEETKLRIAYLSADFRDHPVAHLLRGVLAAHDRRQFEIVGVSLLRDGGPVQQALRQCCDRWLDLDGLTDEDANERLTMLDIDVAVDLNGLTANARPRLLMARPGRLQVNFLGYPATGGGAHLDYIVGDATVIPREHFTAYSEKIVWLPDTFQPNDDRRLIADETPTRAQAGLPDAGFVFCAFNNSYKIQPPVFDVWMRILRRVDGSVLWLRGAGPVFEANLKREAQARGIAPSRLVFAMPTPRIEDHLARQRLADLFLDTLPYNAHTTASDALWAGLPVLTCLGTSYAGRVAASLLRAVGLPELVVANHTDYEALAVRLATHPGELGALKCRLAANRLTRPLFDTERYTRHLEAAYRTMWERQQRGEPPDHFAVPHTGCSV